MENKYKRMKRKSIHQVIPSQKINMEGHIIEQPLSNNSIDRLDPFLLIHHAEWVLKGDQRQQEVASYGPFVMNTQTEIMESVRDSQIGKMGILIEDFD